jgi:ATP-dependent Clp protease ATP-binding subunit ClpB
VYVAQPSVEATTAILRGLKERYEIHHGVAISDAALVAAAQLSDRYISERFLPDKAIDLVDEAAAKMKMDATSRPQLLDEVSPIARACVFKTCLPFSSSPPATLWTKLRQR